MDAIEVDGDMVEIVGPRQAKVQSKSQPTIWYAVDLDAHTCTCKGYEIRKACRHYDAVEGFVSGRTQAAGTGEIVEVKMATSRYQNGEEIVASGAVPVGITVGYPRFKLKGYKPVMMQELAPKGIDRDTPSDKEFERLYRLRLESFGLDRIKRRFSEIAVEADNRYLVLLCYEDLTKPGEVCHRRMFAKWWEEVTGYVIYELGPAAPEQLS